MPDIPKKYAADFALLVAAAVRGDRSPMTYPDGPLRSGAVSALYKAGCIRSEVFALNFRRITILVGEHCGKCTASPLVAAPPWKINGRPVGG